MKILIVISDYFNTSNGLCVSTQRFVNEFRKLGHEVRIMSSNNGGEPDYSLKVKRYPFINKVMEKQNFHFAKPDKKLISEALDWADIVHVEDPFRICHVVARMAKKRGMPITGTYHLYPENMTYTVRILNTRFFNKLFMNFFRGYVYKNCRIIQCPTKKVEERLNRKKYKPQKRTISNAIREDFIGQDRKPHPHDDFRIISIGRYSREKHQIVLMKAIEKSKYKDNIRLIMPGRGPLMDKYAKMAHKVTYPIELLFVKQEELKKLISTCDLYVHCAVVEIEGMSCMEAFALGCVPIIADSHLSSTAQYALTPNNKFEANNVDELASKIDYWYEHRDELNKASKEYIEYGKNLSISVSAKKVIEMMEDAIALHSKK